MDINTLRGLATLFAFIAFISVCFWAYSSRKKKDFDEAAQLPFADEVDEPAQNADNLSHPVKKEEGRHNPMSNFWSGWIIVLTLACLALVIWVLYATHKAQRKHTTTETTGHSYDGIEELDNPMPHWWVLLFVATLVFSAIYLIFYPRSWQLERRMGGGHQPANLKVISSSISDATLLSLPVMPTHLSKN